MDDYINIDSIDPKYWGKGGWIFLNSIALTYNPKFKNQYKTFFLHLPFVLPCQICGENLKKNLYNLDDALISKQNLFLWLLNIRNEIYKSEKKSIKTIHKTIKEIYKSKKHKKYIKNI